MPVRANCASYPASIDGGTEACRGIRCAQLARSFQLVEQGLCLFEIGGGEAFGEPAVDRGSRARSAEAARNRPLHVGALGAPNGLKALEGLALVFKPEK
jgi:hypothetical protein